MIIQNNFNSQSATPLDDYESIGGGRNRQKYKKEQEHPQFIKENLNNPIIQNVLDKDSEFDDNTKEDKWDFFR